MADKDQTTREKTEYSKLCKTIRKKIRENIREHNTMRVKEAIENGKGLEKATKRKEGYKVLIPELKEQDRIIITNRERILERCAEFYENLYEDATQNVIRSEAEEVPKQRNRVRNEKHGEQQSTRRGTDCHRNVEGRRRSRSGKNYIIDR